MTTTAHQIWDNSIVPNGKVQFLASILVMQHLAKYRFFNAHKERVMGILKARQY